MLESEDKNKDMLEMLMEEIQEILFGLKIIRNLKIIYQILFQDSLGMNYHKLFLTFDQAEFS
jgi:hypothetical protein